MEYLILNEESLPFETIEDCKKSLQNFFEILHLAFKERITSIRVSENFDKGWYNLEITKGYFVRNWLNSQNKDFKIRLKNIIDKTKCPHIPDIEIEALTNAKLSDFSLRDNPKIKTPSLGVAFLLTQLAISFNSNKFWAHSIIHLLKESLTDKDQIQTSHCIAQNITNISHWQKYFAEIENERRNNQRKGVELWEYRNQEFENLIFTVSTEKQFKRLTINNATFRRLWTNLKLLNKFIPESTNNSELKEKTNLNFTPESKSVTNNPKLKRHRLFTLPNGKKQYFELHIKNFPATARLHFYPDYEKQLIYIGYFGKHLPT